MPPDRRRSSRFKRSAAKLLLAAVAVLLALGLGEILLRLVQPFGGFVLENELIWFRRGQQELLENAFTLDPDFGFRPRLGQGERDEHGALINTYEAERPPGVSRALFIGDSVTYRGRIVEALRQVYGAEDFEYWNAGVESFNAVQAVNFYLKYNSALGADHVILSFHNNDFQSTPVAFFDQGRLVVYAPGRPSAQLNPWLFRKSHLYRFLLSFGSQLSGPPSGIVAETTSSLLDLKRSLEAQDIRFTVLLLPVFAPEKDWSRTERRSREAALEILQGNGFRFFDLLVPMTEAIQDGVDVQEQPGDPWHPSAGVAGYFARYLHARGLLPVAAARPDTLR